MAKRHYVLKRPPRSTRPPTGPVAAAVTTLDTHEALFPQIRNPRQRAFLAAYALCGILTNAAQAANVDMKMHYVWRRDPVYAAAFDEAKLMTADVHEDEATRRALGWDETRYTADGVPYAVRKYSDTMMVFRLKALRPDVYRDKSAVNVTIHQSETIQVLFAQLEQEEAHERTTLPPWQPPGTTPAPPLPLMPTSSGQWDLEEEA